MNRTFKTIWSHAQNAWVAVSEVAHAKGKTSSAGVLAGGYCFSPARVRRLQLVRLIHLVLAVRKLLLQRRVRIQLNLV